MKKKEYRWNLKLLYTSPKDPQIEKDIRNIEHACVRFAAKYDREKKNYLNDPRRLLCALHDYEKWVVTPDNKPFIYFKSIVDTDTTNKEATAASLLIQNRISKATNLVRFFRISLGRVSKQRQAAFLRDSRLAHYRVFLKRIFDNGRYSLSLPEEKILRLKQQPAHSMWVSANERILNQRTISWKGKKMPLSEVANLIPRIKNRNDRHRLYRLFIDQLKTVSPVSEAELNAIITNKKTNDELRGFATPYESTVKANQNDLKTIETLAAAVTGAFPLVHRFYKIKKKLLGLKTMAYCDRNASLPDSVPMKFSFEKSAEVIKESFKKLGARYPKIIDSYLENGQIDAFPRLGKRGGGFCRSSYSLPTLLFLNHTGNLSSLRTLAHEMGHAFHGELSRSQGPIYSNYSTSLAETASTLFESIATESVFGSLPEKAKVTVLLGRIGDNILTIFYQIACFNFEKELHDTIARKGFVDKGEIADLHNKHIRACIGRAITMTHDDGYLFVSWIHLRLFFYTYTYAYGMLVSKALLRRYKKDASFWKKIEQFLSAGGKDSPENILREVGIDVSKPGFWKEGLKEIEEDIDRLEKLTRK